MSAESIPDTNGERRIRPKKFSHAVIRTTRLKEMVAWYQTVLNAEIMREFPHAVFLTYDEEHHRLAFVAIPGLVERPKLSAGHDHLAYTYESLGDLVATYERLKAAGILPATPVAHGLTTSLYYRDPDGGGVELTVDNLAPSEWRDWMRNQLELALVTFDPEEMVQKYHAGVSDAGTRFESARTLDPGEAFRRMMDA
jgi:catechol-2,3-dioxygenase